MNDSNGISRKIRLYTNKRGSTKRAKMGRRTMTSRFLFPRRVVRDRMSVFTSTNIKAKFLVPLESARAGFPPDDNCLLKVSISASRASKDPPVCVRQILPRCSRTPRISTYFHVFLGISQLFAYLSNGVTDLPGFPGWNARLMTLTFLCSFWASFSRGAQCTGTFREFLRERSAISRLIE